MLVSKVFHNNIVEVYIIPYCSICMKSALTSNLIFLSTLFKLVIYELDILVLGLLKITSLSYKLYMLFKMDTSLFIYYSLFLELQVIVLLAIFFFSTLEVAYDSKKFSFCNLFILGQFVILDFYSFIIRDRKDI